MSLHPETREKIASNAYHDALRERRELEEAEELDTDAIRDAIRTLEGALSHDWFAGLPEIEWDRFMDRTRDLDTARLA